MPIFRSGIRKLCEVFHFFNDIQDYRLAYRHSVLLSLAYYLPDLFLHVLGMSFEQGFDKRDVLSGWQNGWRNDVRFKLSVKVVDRVAILRFEFVRQNSFQAFFEFLFSDFFGKVHDVLRDVSLLLVRFFERFDAYGFTKELQSLVYFFISVLRAYGLVPFSVRR